VEVDKGSRGRNIGLVPSNKYVVCKVRDSMLSPKYFVLRKINMLFHRIIWKKRMKETKNMK
jgi:hypothetical protein